MAAAQPRPVDRQGLAGVAGSDGRADLDPLASAAARTGRPRCDLDRLLSTAGLPFGADGPVVAICIGSDRGWLAGGAYAALSGRVGGRPTTLLERGFDPGRYPADRRFQLAWLARPQSAARGPVKLAARRGAT